MNRLVAASFAVIVGLLGLLPISAHAQSFSEEDPAFLVMSAGYYDVLHNDKDAASFGVEYRHDERFLGIFKPMVATFGSTNGSFWIGAGIAADLYLGDHIVLTGSIAPGFYEQGSGKNLGYPLEFRSQIEVGYRFADHSRLTLGFNHISNCCIGDINPGVEIATVNYYLPLGSIASLLK